MHLHPIESEPATGHKRTPEAPEAALGDFTTDWGVVRLSLLAIVIGCFSAGIAWLLLRLIALFTNVAYFGRFSFSDVTPAQSHLGYAVILIPAIGGLLIGLMARFGSEKIRGHGIPEALEAILIGRSRIEAKVALLKPLSSALSIGTGGPFGAEGPIIMTGGALGSLCAQFIHLSSAERKILLVAGAAGGMAAVFNTPVAAVLLAVELLLFEWKPRSLIPVAFASIAATAMRVPMLGSGPIFPVVPHPALNAVGLVAACGVGLIAGIGSSVLTGMVYGFEDLFSRLRVHWMWWPAIGGLAVGIGGFLDPRVLGVGYGTIHSLLNGQILGTAALGLLVGKAIVWSLSLGSGTSGGVLAPLLMMGGALGALIGQAIPNGSPSLWAMVGMCAMMGGTMRSPFTAIIFTFELSYDARMLPALLIAAIASEGVTVLLLKRSILTEKVARRGHHLSREYVVDPFEVHRVGEVMLTEFPTVDPSAPLAEVLGRDTPAGRWFVARQAVILVDASNRLAGLVTQSDALKVEHWESETRPMIEVGTANPIVLDDGALLRDAVLLMLRHKIARLPIVSTDDRERLVGYMDRSCVMDARLRWYAEEHIREVHPWITALRRSG